MKNSRFAQSATELAVFGAVLVFVIGLILRSGLQTSLQMNAQLRALRMALYQSYLTSKGGGLFPAPNRPASNSSLARNNANIILVEDRLMVSAGGKIPTHDRVPMVTQGSGTMTNELFKPPEFGEYHALGLMDVFVNGKQFIFTTSAYKYINIRGAAGAKPGPAAWSPIPDPTAPDGWQYFIPDCPNNNGPAANRSDRIPPDNPPYGLCWKNQCYVSGTCQPMVNGDYDWVVDPESGGGSCQPAPGGPGTGTYGYPARGCLLMYKQNANFQKAISDGDWCDLAHACSKNLPLSERFDYNHDGVPDVANPGDYYKMTWQWAVVPGVVNGVDLSQLVASGTPAGNPWAGGAVGEGIFWNGKDAPINSAVDADGDYKEEYIMSYNSPDGENIITLNVMDNQEGDMDGTLDDRDGGKWYPAMQIPPPCPDPIPQATERCVVPATGMIAGSPPRRATYFGTCMEWHCKAPEIGLKMDNVTSYSFTYNATGGAVDPADPRRGTYLRIEEGKLFNPRTGQYVRSTTRADHVDIYERAYYLSNNTGRFCNGGVVTIWENWPGIAGTHQGLNGTVLRMLGAVYRPPVVGIPWNPVEACNDCFSAANISKTCMDEAGKIIFIRSRVTDLRGRRWVRRYQ